MTRDSMHLLVAVFDDDEATGQALDEIKQAQKSHILAVEAMATIRSDAQGELQIEEAADPGAKRGALAGGVIGAIIGLLGGPAGAIVAGAAGALVGGVTAEIIDSGIPDQNLELIGQSLLPGDSAVVVIVDEESLATAKRLLEAAGATVLSGSLTSIIAEQLKLPPGPRPRAADDGGESS